MSREPIRRNRTTRKTVAVCAIAPLVLILLTAFLPIRTSLAVAQRADAIILVIAKSTGIADIPLSVVRTAFLGLRADYHGVHLIPLNTALRTPLRERFDRTLLGIEPSEVGSFWIDQRVRDGRTPPRIMPSTEIAIRVVAQLPGAISYVPASSFIEPRVRALRVDGKSASDKGYFLASE